MRVADDEPDLGPWAAEPVWTWPAGSSSWPAPAARARRERPARGGRRRPTPAGSRRRRGGSPRRPPVAVVVHTDDIAWHHGFFDWDGLLVDGVLDPPPAGRPCRSGRRRGSSGTGRAPSRYPQAPLPIFVEGVGSSRASLAPWLDATVWVQSDEAQAYRRGIERDVVLGRDARRGGRVLGRVDGAGGAVPRGGPAVGARGRRPLQHAGTGSRRASSLVSRARAAAEGPGRANVVRNRAWSWPGPWKTRWSKPESTYVLDLRDDLVGVGRDDPARSRPARRAARRRAAPSRAGRSMPCFCSAVRASGAQNRVFSSAWSGSGS